MHPTQRKTLWATDRGGLLQDRRGAVVVMAVFMSMFLVGCLWYLIGIGEAAIYRERLDMAADAAAYTGGVYHARGMNMIAMLNLIIAASMGLIVVAKTLNYIIGIVYYATRFICTEEAHDEPPVKAPECEVSKDAANRLAKLALIINSVDANGDSLLASLSDAQREIAVTTPWVASKEASLAVEDYMGDRDPKLVIGGVAVSPSMTPNLPRYGLPVMEEPFGITCQRGNEIAPELIAAIIPPAYNEYLVMATGQSVWDTIKAYPVSFCGESEWIPSWDLFDEDDVCRDKEREWKWDFKKANGRWPDPDKGEVFDKKKCGDDEGVTDDEVEETMDDEDIPQASPEDNNDTIPQPEQKTAKMLVGGARNGNDYFQVYSTVLGNTERLRRPDTGVQVATGQKVTVAEMEDDALEKFGISQAEFYYDQTPAAVSEDRCWNSMWKIPLSCGMDWPEYAMSTMWNLRWRARLRPVTMPTADMGQPGGIGNVLASGLPGTAPISQEDYIPWQIGILNGAVDDDVLGGFFRFRGALNDAILNN